MHRPPAGRLRPFRLNDIPLDVRVRAAKRAPIRALPDDAADPRDRLFATLAAPALDDERGRLVRAAEDPSERVYWIREKAWKQVMG